MHRENVRNAMAVRRWPALRKHVDEDKGVNDSFPPCGTQKTTIINMILVTKFGGGP